MNIFNIIFFLVLFILILVYIKNIHLNEDFANQKYNIHHHVKKQHNKHHDKHHDKHQGKKDHELKNPHFSNRTIDLTKDSTIIKDCKNGFCYYDLDNIMKRHKADDPHGNFNAKHNKGEKFIVTGGGTPLLLNKGLQVVVKVINDKVHYIVSPLK